MKIDQRAAKDGPASDFFVLKVPCPGLNWSGITNTGCAIPIATGYVHGTVAVWALVTLGVAGLLRDVALCALSRGMSARWTGSPRGGA